MRRIYWIPGIIVLGILFAWGAGIGLAAQPSATPPQPNDPAANSRLPEDPDAITFEPAGLINYQGRLLQGSMPFHGTIGMTFRFYQVSTGGDPWYTETQTVTVSNGLFSVLLGSVEPLDGWAEKFARQVWLGIQPAGAAKELTPRQPMGAAASAFSLMPGSTIYDINSGNVAQDHYIHTFYVSADNHPAASFRSNSNYAIAAYGNGGSGVRVDSVAGKQNDDYGVRATSDMGDAVFSWSTGASNDDHGLSARSLHGYGVYGWAETSGGYGFYTDQKIYAGGGCTGCTLSYVSHNTGETNLTTGDLVHVLGVETAWADTATPVMQVAAARDGEAVLGVVAERVEISFADESQENMAPGAYFHPAQGAAAPGDYVIIVIQGMAQINVSGLGLRQPGSTLYWSPQGLTSEQTDTTIGVLLSEADAKGLAWVLLGIH
ncbi:MAG: hypothetical protein JW726_00480 [Anaerolineales bacterium]|nr:hypothetical protein [Anaerolineales bacterium]